MQNSWHRALRWLVDGHGDLLEQKNDVLIVDWNKHISSKIISYVFKGEIETDKNLEKEKIQFYRIGPFPLVLSK